MSNKHYVKGLKRRARRATGFRLASVGDLYRLADQQRKNQVILRAKQVRAAYEQRQRDMGDAPVSPGVKFKDPLHRIVQQDQRRAKGMTKGRAKASTS